VPDLNLHIARMLSLMRLPARLAKYVLSAAVQDFVDEVRATDPTTGFRSFGGQCGAAG
jgi:hypothetical protein